MRKIISSICIITGIFIIVNTAGYLCAAEKKSDDDSKKDIEMLRQELKKMTKASETANKKLAPLKEENDRLRSERAGIYRDMGTTYTRAGLYDEAIKAYKESLKYSPNNAEVHYYLGLLYQKSRKDPQTAVFHLKRYLYLNPDAKNKDEVKYMTEMLVNQR